MDITSYIFLVKIHCPDCNNMIPVNKVQEYIHCYNCKSEVHLPGKWWRKNLLTDKHLKKAKKFKDGEAIPSIVIAGMLKFDIAYGKRFPRCQKCKDSLAKKQYWTLDEILSSVESSDHIKCKRCNTPYAIRKPDDFIRSFLEYPVYALIGEKEEPKQDVLTKGKSVMFTCLNCGASLKVDGSDRVVECSFCNTDNFLPEELWKRLYPIPKADVFFMLIEFEEPR